jgi:hypothetical protein
VSSGRQLSFLLLGTARADAAAKATKPVNVVTIMRILASIAPPGSSVDHNR